MGKNSKVSPLIWKLFSSAFLLHRFFAVLGILSFDFLGEMWNPKVWHSPYRIALSAEWCCWFFRSGNVRKSVRFVLWYGLYTITERIIQQTFLSWWYFCQQEHPALGPYSRPYFQSEHSRHLLLPVRWRPSIWERNILYHWQSRTPRYYRQHDITGTGSPTHPTPPPPPEKIKHSHITYEDMRNRNSGNRGSPVLIWKRN